MRQRMIPSAASHLHRNVPTLQACLISRDNLVALIVPLLAVGEEPVDDCTDDGEDEDEQGP
jgi:hypothetical protein